MMTERLLLVNGTNCYENEKQGCHYRRRAFLIGCQATRPHATCNAPARFVGGYLPPPNGELPFSSFSYRCFLAQDFLRNVASVKLGAFKRLIGKEVAVRNASS